MEANVEIDAIANELIEVKESLDNLAANYVGLEGDPFFYEPLEKINHILEEIE